MLFSSFTFLIYYLPIVIVVHYLLPQKAKNGFIFLASVVFYAWGELRYVPLIFVSMLINYLCGLGCGSDKRWLKRLSLILSLALNFGVLLYYKYSTFLLSIFAQDAIAPDIALPLGISFYTFQVQSYVIDVYRKDVPCERNIISYGTFMMMFPQLIAGPIVLYSDVRRELRERRRDSSTMESGMTKFIIGLACKVLLANPLGEIWVSVQGMLNSSSLTLLLAITSYGLQIYFDFYGYSLMAIGIGEMLGFHFPKNFCHPYASRSIKEFFRRWHITLGNWFRQYIYIPIINQTGARGRHVAAFIVWFLTGLWHGASWNFVAWGLWFFLLLMLERFLIGRWLQRHKTLSHIYTLWGVFMGWILFAHTSFSDAWSFIVRLYRFIPGDDWVILLRGNVILLLIAVICCIPKIVHFVMEKLTHSTVLRVAVLTVVLLLSIATLLNAEYSPFLYFRF